MITEPTGSITPPMPEPPSMRGADGRLVPDAIGFSRLVAYVQAIQDYATAGWVKFQELEATLEEAHEATGIFGVDEPMSLLDSIHALKAKLEIATAELEAHARHDKYSEQDYAWLKAKLEEAENQAQDWSNAFANLSEINELRHFQAAAMAEALDEVSEYLHNIPHPDDGGDAEGYRLAGIVRTCLITYREGR